MFELVARTNLITPPTAFEKAVFDTLLRFSSASQRGIKQIYDRESAKSSPGKSSIISKGSLNNILRKRYSRIRRGIFTVAISRRKVVDP